MRLGLAVKPLTKLARSEGSAGGIRVVSPEEAYDWYSKCTARETVERALRVLRVGE
ncbi:MAG: hypothetical protein V9H69_00800 [Anaerolineae bacterium]|jgi:hypothetical protein